MKRCPKKLQTSRQFSYKYQQYWVHKMYKLLSGQYVSRTNVMLVYDIFGMLFDPYIRFCLNDYLLTLDSSAKVTSYFFPISFEMVSYIKRRFAVPTLLGVKCGARYSLRLGSLRIFCNNRGISNSKGPICV